MSETFMDLICQACDKTPREMAKAIGVSYKELVPLLASRHSVAEIDRDEVWYRVSEYVATRIGYMLAVKGELNKALQQDRKKRILRKQRFDNLF